MILQRSEVNLCEEYCQNGDQGSQNIDIRTYFIEAMQSCI